MIRENIVHDIYDELLKKYGKEVFFNLSKSFIYSEIGKQTGLGKKTISSIISSVRPKFTE